jgi:transcriptional regulator with XRE-family HTH domain
MDAIDSGMLDLSKLGHELRTRRRALRIPSAELARRIGVSPTYVWLIEQSKPRKSGEPSRPSEDLLRKWTSAIGMSATDAQEIRELAGYFGPDFRYEHSTTSSRSTEVSMRSPSTDSYPPDENDAKQDGRRGSSTRSYGRAGNLTALQQWAGSEEIDGRDDADEARQGALETSR